MKVLLVNCVYGQGSTGKILKSLHQGLIARGWDSYVRYGRGQISSEPNVEKLASERVAQLQALASRISGYSYSCSPITTKRLKDDINQIKPNIVNLHCINANTVNIAEILEFLKRKNIPTVVTAHAEFLYTGGCGHALTCNKWKTGCGNCPQFHSPDSQLSTSYLFDRSKSYWHALEKAYSGFNDLRITGVSPWLVDRIKQSPFFSSEQVCYTPNGVDTNIFHPRLADDLRRCHGIAETAKVYLHVTPNFKMPLKGGKYILELANRINEIRPKDIVIIIGYDGSTADLPKNVIPITHTNNQEELAEYYSMADATVIASSRETFSMVTAESLCCGTPVVGFKAGGPESICRFGHASFCEYGDIVSLVKNSITIYKSKEISSIYTKEFSMDSMTRQYMSVYNKIVKK